MIEVNIRSACEAFSLLTKRIKILLTKNVLILRVINSTISKVFQ